MSLQAPHIKHSMCKHFIKLKYIHKLELEITILVLWHAWDEESKNNKPNVECYYK